MTRALSIGLLLLTALLGAPPAADEEAPAPDAFEAALAAMGIGADELGYRPKASWSRYPHPKTVPYVMPFFEDLLANPLDTYVFTRTLGNVVEDWLDPALLSGARVDEKKKETLFQLGVFLATDRRIGGFRAYSANLDPRPSKTDPLFHALVRLLDRSGADLTRGKTFGQADADPAKDPMADLRAQVDRVPKILHPGLATLVLNLIDARTWIDRGLRDVPQRMRDDVF
nr:hypothetical protein [Planctomycetota bacterium]